MNRVLLPCLTFFSALCLYLRTLMPGVFVSDFAEFQYLPFRLGLPHPNGFPFYMLLGWLWSHLPLGSLAWRMNLLSALGGALAVGITTAFVLRLSGRFSVALLAGGLLALSPTFWGYSLAAERYTLNLALLAGALWAMWEAGQQQSRKLGYLSAFLISLGLATHPSDALLVPFWLAYLIWRLGTVRRSVRFWIGLVLSGALPLLLYIYVPLRWMAFSQWPSLPGIGRSSAIYRGMVHGWYQAPMTWNLVRDYIMGLGGYITGLVTGDWQEALRGLSELLPYWVKDVPWVITVLAVAGVLGLRRRAVGLVAVMGTFAALLVLMVAYVRLGKNEAYLLPAFWVVYVWAALALDVVIAGATRLWARRQNIAQAEVRWPSRAATLLTIGLLIALLWRRYPHIDLSRWTDTRRWWDVTLMQPIEQGAGLLANWSDLTPLWYLQQTEGRRIDLWGLYPPDPAQVIQPWLASGHALYLAAPLHGWAPDLTERYRLVPWGTLARILLPDQRTTCPPLAHAGETPSAWPFSITGWEFQGPLRGDAVSLLLFCWEARTDLPREAFLRLHLQETKGDFEIAFNEPLVSAWYPELEVSAGSQGLAVVPVRLPLGIPPGTYRADLLAYRLHEDQTITPWQGVEPISLGAVTVTPSRELNRDSLTDEVVPVLPWRAGPLTLRAWRISRPAVRPGDPVQVELLWEIRERLLSPLTLSFGFRDLGRGILSAQSQLATFPPPDGSDQQVMLVRSLHNLRAPRGRGDHTYLLELRLRHGQEWLNWGLIDRLPLGTVRVRDRSHLDGLPQGIATSDFSFGGVAQLAGFRVDATEIRQGSPLALTLYWKALAESDSSYAVFIHLLDAQGRVVAQDDGVPANGTLPTNLWVRGEIIADSHSIAIPDDLPAGIHTLRIGLYSPQTTQRLLLAPTDGGASGDSVTLGSVRVVAP